MAAAHTKHAAAYDGVKASYLTTCEYVGEFFEYRVHLAQELPRDAMQRVSMRESTVSVLP
jgi:hypothetical protein